MDPTTHGLEFHRLRPTLTIANTETSAVNYAQILSRISALKDQLAERSFGMMTIDNGAVDGQGSASDYVDEVCFNLDRKPVINNLHHEYYEPAGGSLRKKFAGTGFGGHEGPKRYDVRDAHAVIDRETKADEIDYLSRPIAPEEGGNGGGGEGPSGLNDDRLLPRNRPRTQIDPRTRYGKNTGLGPGTYDTDRSAMARQINADKESLAFATIQRRSARNVKENWTTHSLRRKSLVRPHTALEYHDGAPRFMSPTLSATRMLCEPEKQPEIVNPPSLRAVRPTPPRYVCRVESQGVGGDTWRRVREGCMGTRSVQAAVVLLSKSLCKLKLMF